MRRKTETKIKESKVCCKTPKIQEITVRYNTGNILNSISIIPVLYQSTVTCMHKHKFRLYYSTTYNAIPKVSASAITSCHCHPITINGIYYTFRQYYISVIQNRFAAFRIFGAEKNFAADFRAEKSQEGLRRKRNDRRCPINLGQRILKIVVFEARRRLLHPHFGLGSYANVFYIFICCLTSEPEMRVKEKESIL